MIDTFRCPDCISDLNAEPDQLICRHCGHSFPVTGSVPDFRKNADDSYWGNISREKMQELNKTASESGDWYQASQKLIPEYADHFIPYYRADCQFMWPTDKYSKVLDAGSMWGGISIPAAQYHGEVYAVDKTIETLEFLKIRSQQMGCGNIYPVAAPLRSLPFSDNFFDLVILNGVLEWVAVDEKITLEKQWGEYGSGLRLENRKYPETPGQMQLGVLRELERVLKPQGALYLAIENRIGYTFLAGYPDDHMNLPYICFLPRFLANLVTRYKLNCDYRTYVYTIAGYRSLLKKAGLSSIEFYGAFEHYIDPTHVVPLSLIENFKTEVITNSRGQTTKYLSKLFKYIPPRLLKHLSPSVIAISSGGRTDLKRKSRICRLFQKAGIIQDPESEFTVVKYPSRPENHHAVNYLVSGCIESPSDKNN